MVTSEQLQARLAECNYPYSDASLSVIAAARRGDVVIIINKPDGKRFVGAYMKDSCRPLSEVFPEAHE